MNLLQAIWNRAIGNGNRARKNLLRSILIGGIPFMWYWILGLAFYKLDTSKKPAFLYKYVPCACVRELARVCERAYGSVIVCERVCAPPLVHMCA